MKEKYKKFFANISASLGILYIFIVFILAVFAYAFASDSTPSANRIHLQLALQSPGFSCNFIGVKKGKISTSVFERMFSGGDDEAEYIPVANVKIENNFVIYNEIISASESSQENIKIPSSLLLKNGNSYIFRKTYFLGSDRYGRDMLSRMMVGARISLAVGFLAVLVSLIIGLGMGMPAGYFGGTVDTVVSWIINVVWSLPSLLIALCLTLAFGKGFMQIFIAIGLSMWVDVARIVRGQVLSLKEKEFIEAAKSLGASHSRIMFKHLLPNIIAPLIVVCTANFSAAILLEAGLSFLGIGIQPPEPSWGQILREHYSYIVLNKPFLALIPGCAIMLLVISFNMVGAGLRDALDVRD